MNKPKPKTLDERADAWISRTQGWLYVWELKALKKGYKAGFKAGRRGRK